LIPIAAGAILYDLGIGNSHARPNLAVGEAAADAATDQRVREGCMGAGTGATAGKLMGMSHTMKSGLGSFTIQMPALCRPMNAERSTAVRGYATLVACRLPPFDGRETPVAPSLSGSGVGQPS